MILCFISFVWNKWSVLHYKNTIKEKYRSINRSRVLEFEVRVLYIIKQIREMNLNSQLTFFFFFKVCFPYDGLRLHFFFFFCTPRETNARVDEDRGSIELTRHGVFIHRYKYEWTPVAVKRVVDLFFGFPCDVTAIYVYRYPRLSAVGERGEKK